MVTNGIYKDVYLICWRGFDFFTLRENIHRIVSMKKIFVILSFLILSSCQTTGGMKGIDKDWDVGFYDNCGLPKDTLKTIEEDGNKFLRFQLKGGQKGGCNSDRRPRHNASFWERSELKQSGKLHRNSIYEINYKVRFISGFKGSRESFFQIHQSDSGCRGAPLVMVKFDQGILYGNTAITIEDIIGNWVNFKMILDLVDMSYDIYLNDKLFIEDRFRTTLNGCARPHIKFGIYRPGYYSTNGSLVRNNTSIVDFDDMKVKKLNP